MGLPAIRKKIDAVDKKLLMLIAKRQAYVKCIAHYKARHKMPIFQPKREKEILSKKKVLAEKLNIGPMLVGEVWRALFKNSRLLQKNLLMKKRRL